MTSLPPPSTDRLDPVLADPPKERRRVFPWLFLAVQALFLIWVVAGAASGSGTPTDCGSLTAEACNDAESIGTALGVAFIIFMWVAVDFILAVTYLIFRAVRR